MRCASLMRTLLEPVALNIAFNGLKWAGCQQRSRRDRAAARIRVSCCICRVILVNISTLLLVMICTKINLVATRDSNSHLCFLPMSTFARFFLPTTRSTPYSQTISWNRFSRLRRWQSSASSKSGNAAGGAAPIADAAAASTKRQSRFSRAYENMKKKPCAVWKSGYAVMLGLT